MLVAAIAAVGTFAIGGGRLGGAGDAPRAGMRPSLQPSPLRLDWLALLAWPTPQLTPANTATAKPPAAEAPAVQVAPSEPVAPAPAAREWQDVDFAAQVLALLNGERQARGLAPLVENGALVASSQAYADTLTQLGTLSHTAAGDLASRVLANGYGGGSTLGEALWMGGGVWSPADVVAAWLGSPAHSALILNPAYVLAGTACYFKQAESAYEGRCVLILGG